MTAALYLESSAVLRYLLEGEAAIGHLIRQADSPVASPMLPLEVKRSLVRAVRTNRVGPTARARAIQTLAQWLETAEIIPLSDRVIARAGEPFPVEPVRAIDAIHLASAQECMTISGSVTVLSCDARVRQNALALGMAILPA